MFMRSCLDVSWKFPIDSKVLLDWRKKIAFNSKIAPFQIFARIQLEFAKFVKIGNKKKKLFQNGKTESFGLSEIELLMKKHSWKNQ